MASGLADLPESGLVVVMAGDAPLFRAETLQSLLDAHDERAWVTVLTARVDEPARYGRVIRDEQGQPLRIVEASEATEEELAVREINTGAYVFDIAFLRQSLPTLKPHAHKDEIYLTDVLELAAVQGRARAVIHHDVAEIMGVNDRWALAEARTVLQQRVLRAHALSGVTIEEPVGTMIEMGVTLGQDVRVGPGAIIREGTSVGAESIVGPGCVLENSQVGESVEILAYSSLESAVVENGARIGPYARLRPGAQIGPEARVGNFVEIKKSTLGPGAKANHLTYIGDAHVGAGANVGAGTITCNYDGYLKHRTEIGEGAFIGSNSALVAPFGWVQGPSWVLERWSYRMSQIMPLPWRVVISGCVKVLRCDSENVNKPKNRPNRAIPTVGSRRDEWNNGRLESRTGPGGRPCGWSFVCIGWGRLW